MVAGEPDAVRRNSPSSSAWLRIGLLNFNVNSRLLGLFNIAFTAGHCIEVTDETFGRIAPYPDTALFSVESGHMHGDPQAYVTGSGHIGRDRFVRINVDIGIRVAQSHQCMVPIGGEVRFLLEFIWTGIPMNIW
jgi:hypothetical protein